MTDSYIYIITALLPLAASLLIFQVNPYHALVMRGVLGALAALIYTVLGAADVALTEALVGTLLAITLYAIAVRSSLVLRLGILKDEAIIANADQVSTPNNSPNNLPNNSSNYFSQLIADIRSIFSKRHMRVELIAYPDKADLQQALINKEVHVICIRSSSKQRQQQDQQPYSTTTRLRRLYEIMQPELASSLTELNYANLSSAKNPGEVH
jgi:putative multicomponent Na+:H+ antiporter subunit B